MLYSSLVAAAGLFAIGTHAAASSCMTDDGAQRVAGNFATLISAYTNASAEAYLCSDFHDYSDSVIELINGGCPNSPIPLGVPTFSDRTSFEAGQGSQPNITFNLLNVWHNCDTVTLRWRTPNPGPVEPVQFVTGIIVLETVYAGASAPEPFLIETVYSEFNSGAWLVDLGVFTPTCSSGPESSNSTATASASGTATAAAKSKRGLAPHMLLPARMA